MGEVNLPEGWAQTVISDIADVNPKKIEAEAEALSGFVPMSHAPTDFNGTLSFEEKPWGEIKKSYTNFQDHDVIVAKVTPCFENGKAAIVRGLPNGIGAGSSEFYVLRPAIKEVSTRFLFSIVKSHKFLHEGAANMTGAVGLRRVPRAFVETFPIALPPPAEQKVIADKLDTLLAQVETTKARLDRIPKILKTFRQSVLAAAVSGKLTEEWRKLYKASCVDVKHNSKLPELSESDCYLKDVEGWVWLRLGSVVSLINGDRGKNYPNKSEYVENGIPFINTGHIDPDGTLSDKRMNFISHTKYDSLGSGKTERTDLVYCLRGATMGKTARVHYDVGAIASSLVIVRPSKQINRDFAYYFLVSPIAKKLISEFDNGSAQPNLSAKSLATYPLQLPSVEEQTEIVRRIEEMFAFIDRIEQKANAALERVNNLTQSILAKAFRGELTADWRAQNPDLISGENSAEALLEKIKAEREALKNQPKPKRSAVKKKTGSQMNKQIIKVVDALKQAGKPLSGQQLLAAAGYPSDSSTDQLETFFLDIREALTTEKSIVKFERNDDGQDWFALAEADENNKA